MIEKVLDEAPIQSQDYSGWLKVYVRITSSSQPLDDNDLKVLASYSTNAGGQREPDGKTVYWMVSSLNEGLYNIVPWHCESVEIVDNKVWLHGAATISNKGTADAVVPKSDFSSIYSLHLIFKPQSRVPLDILTKKGWRVLPVKQDRRFH